MRLVHNRNRNDQRRRGLRIEISQAEITADLHYRGGSRREVRQAPARPVGR